MRYFTLFILLGLLSAPLNAQAPSLGQPRLLNTRAVAGQVVEISLPLSANAANPYDPNQITVDADLRGPQGQGWTQAAFFLASQGRQGAWKLRLNLPSAGTWEVTFRAALAGKQALAKPFAFQVLSGKPRGAVRVSAKDSRYFAFASGQPFLPIGLNLGWAGKRGVQDYKDWLAAMGKVGANWARVWLWSTFSWAKTMDGETQSGHLRAGEYDPAFLNQLDQLFEAALSRGVQLQLCLDSFGLLKQEAFVKGPYHSAQGGPISAPGQFWSDEKARELYKRKLRYLAARYGAYPNLFAWEFWNELNSADGYDAGQAVGWHVHMAGYLRQVDRYGHLISTSYSDAVGDPGMWRQDAIDFVQGHCYNIDDPGAQLPKMAQKLAAYGKPVLMAEFGAKDDEDAWIKSGSDLKGVHMKAALWTLPLSGAAGTGMLWYWGNYVHPNNLWRHFAGPARFFAGLGNDLSGWKEVEPGLSFAQPAQVQGYRDVVLAPDSPQWGAVQGSFQLDAQGRLTPATGLGQYLYGPAKPEYQKPLVIKGGFPAGSRLAIRVLTVSTKSRLRAKADGRLVFDKPLPGGPGQGEWKRSVYKEEWKIYQNEYDRDYAFDIPAGTKEISLENTEGDWLNFGQIRLENVMAKPQPPLQAFFMATSSRAAGYLKHSGWHWKAAEAGGPRPCPPTILHLPSLAAGNYKADFIDTGTGEPWRSQRLQVKVGGLKLALPELAQDLALSVERE